MTTNEQKPLAWLRIEAADEARCDSLLRLASVEPDWKQAKKVMNDSEEALLEAQTAAREMFPDSAYDQETSRALNQRCDAFEGAQLKFKKIDSRRRVLLDETKKLTESELTMISEAREPGIFADGSKNGPNAWKFVKLRDLTGGPDLTKDLEKQVWTAAGLETQGYHTVDEFLKGRDRLIPQLIDDAELARDTVAIVDTAVYRFLEKRNLLDKWPKGVDAPNGEQMTILQTSETTEPEKPKKSKKSKNEKPKPKAKPETKNDAPKLKLAGSDSDLIELPGIKDFYDAEIEGESEFKDELEGRETTIGMLWADLFHGTPMMSKRPTDEELQIFSSSIAPRFGEFYIEILSLLREGRELPANPITDASFGVMTDLVCYWATTKGDQIGEMVDEWSAWFSRQVCNLGGDSVRKLTQWSSDVGAMVAAHQDIASNNGLTLEERIKPEEPAKTKKKAKKKTTKKKRTASNKSAG